MIKLEKTDVWGFEHAIRGMRNPMNSWDKSDSSFCSIDSKGVCENPKEYLLCEDCNVRSLTLGKNDLSLMKRLIKAGTDHRKFMRQIFVSVDITAPIYWWKEFDTYKVGTVANSTSTMHKIHSRPIKKSDFSRDYLKNIDYDNDPHITTETGDSFIDYSIFADDMLEMIIKLLNKCRKKFLDTNDKKYWYQMIQLLPESYNQTRTVTMSYENILNMYHARKNHKLDEWRIGFCDWVKTLPYAKELIIGEVQK